MIDYLFDVALGGGTGVNMHGGGRSPGYTPIADDDGGVVEARPEYYGLLLFALAGHGTLLETQLAAGTVDATAYAVRTASGGLNLVVVNKDTLQNMTLTIETNQNIQSATLQTMTGASLAATSGVTIQGATVNPDGSFFPCQSRHTNAGGYADDLLHPRTDRGADQHHLIRLETVAAGAHEAHFVVVSFWEFKVVFFGKFSGHSALPLLDLSGKSSPISLEWHEAPATKCFILGATLLHYKFCWPSPTPESIVCKVIFLTRPLQFSAHHRPRLSDSAGGGFEQRSASQAAEPNQAHPVDDGDDHASQCAEPGAHRSCYPVKGLRRRARLLPWLD